MSVCVRAGEGGGGSHSCREALGPKVWVPYARQDGVRLWEHIPLAVPAMLLVLVLPAWETTVWLTCGTVVFLWVPWDMPPSVVLIPL